MPDNQQLLYLMDPQTLEFQTDVLDVIDLPDGRLGAILSRSYFYPTGGGQEHDTGSIGEARVIDVIKRENPPVVVHVIDRSLPLGVVTGKIENERRQRHQQHHTAQHLLTQCFVHLFDLDTLSANINGYSPSTLDLPEVNLLPAQLKQAEQLANRLIYENLLVKSYFVTPEELEKLPLRRAPKVSEDIRVIEIDGFDFTPCGGTHCASTGQIGMIKIVKVEKQNDRTRIHFVAGWQGLELFQSCYETVSGLATSLSVGQSELVMKVQRQGEQLLKLQRDLQVLRMEHLSSEADQLGNAAIIVEGQHLVLAVYQDRPVNELRKLGMELAKKSKLVGVFATVEGQKISLVVSCGDQVKVAANRLLEKILVPFQGRGGGNSRLAQGGGSAVDPDQVEEIIRNVLTGYFQG
jgi:alanyl-tRNA synthetase